MKLLLLLSVLASAALCSPLDLGFGGVYNSPEAQKYWNRRFGKGVLSAARSAAKKFTSRQPGLRERGRTQPLQIPKNPKIPKLQLKPAAPQRPPVQVLPTLYPPVPTSVPKPATSSTTTTTTVAPKATPKKAVVAPTLKLNASPKAVTLKAQQQQILLQQQQQQQQLLKQQQLLLKQQQQLAAVGNSGVQYYYVPNFFGTLAAPSKFWNARVVTP